MSNTHKKPKVNDIISALDKSGYLMEQSLALVLEEFGFVSDTNYHYLDPDEGTSREMDLRGYTLKKISQRWFSHHLSITTIISCRVSTNPIVFFQRRSVVPSEYMSGDFLMLSSPDKIPGPEDEPVDIQEFINLRKFHHYYKSPNISTQFCEIVYNDRTKRFETKHEEYKSEILPLIKAIDFEIKKARKEELRREVINFHTFYPVVVLRGELFACNITNNNQPVIKKVKYLNYLQDYNSRTLKGEFRIDIVTESYFKKLLQHIDTETDEIIKKVNKKRKFLLEVIKKSKRKKNEI